MSTKTSIEWTEQTWNPTSGCSKVSPGCQNCYAESMARRLKAMGVKGYESGFKLTLHPNRLFEPLRRNVSTVYFVNSMSDIFHEKIPDGYVKRVFDVIKEARQHVFQILTKRADRMTEFLNSYELPLNAWIGVTVENRQHGIPRINKLRQVKSHIRFLSIEPLLEDLGELDLTDIHWVIVGGESGLKARPVKEEWILNIKRQCEKQNVAFFFKQWGGINKKKAGRTLEGRTWDEMPNSFAI